MNNTVALELKNISKCFGQKYANQNVDLTLYKGEILADVKRTPKKEGGAK